MGFAEGIRMKCSIVKVRDFETFKGEAKCLAEAEHGREGGKAFTEVFIIFLNK